MDDEKRTRVFAPVFGQIQFIDTNQEIILWICEEYVNKSSSFFILLNPLLPGVFVDLTTHSLQNLRIIY